MSTNLQHAAGREFDGLKKGLFWGWNAVFLAFMLLGFVPLQMPQLIQSVRSGVTPVFWLVFSVVMIAIPAAAALAGGLFLRRFPGRLFALAYVVEWPVLLVLLFRYFLIREGNPAVTVLLSWLAAAEAVFLWHLFDLRLDERSAFWQRLRLAGLTLLFAGTIYAAGWLAFYVPPVAVIVVDGFRNFFDIFNEAFRNPQGQHWYAILMGIVGYLLMLFSGMLIAVMPAAGPILAGQAWRHSLARTRRTGGLAGTLAVALLPLAVVLSLLGAGMRQPQHAAFRLLEQPPATIEQAAELLKNEDRIRAGLLNSYLAPFRYMSSVGEVWNIRELYQYVIKLPEESARRLQSAYEVVVRPLLYEPVHAVDMSSDNRVFAEETVEAAELYQRFFDRNINEGERDAVVHAVRASFDGAQAELAWQAVDDREAHLNRQEINIAEHGDWADVELYEVYENRTSRRQEVVYYFSLPESAVVTGLWLGSSSDRSQAFAFQVATRGAAQALYRNEVRYNRDPALVEQVGPRQYRLRVFPLEARQWIAHEDIPRPGAAVHVWMTYRTMAVDGAWPLPQLAEKRNVFWDGQTVRLINGVTWPGSEAAWLPAAVPAAQPVVQTAHRVDFSGGQSVVLLPADGAGAPELPKNLRVAVVLDRSFSMSARASEVKENLVRLKQLAASGTEPDVFLTSSPYRGESPGRVGLASLDPDQVVYFGGQNAAELLAQFETLRAGKQYDIVIVLTDITGYEPGAGTVVVPVPAAPVWMVHQGGGFPMAYDDQTLEAIQASGGGIAGTLEEALARFAATRGTSGQLDQVDGYTWHVLSTAEAGGLVGATPTEPDGGQGGLAAIAARRVLLAEMAKNRGSLDQLPVLDELHALAVEQGIVTPYSSMIVLVNDAQQNLLDQLEQRDDRFEREVENVGETSSANPFAVTGVPEPEEWLLLLLAAGMLAYAGWRKLVLKPDLR